MADGLAAEDAADEGEEAQAAAEPAGKAARVAAGHHLWRLWTARCFAKLAVVMRTYGMPPARTSISPCTAPVSSIRAAPSDCARPSNRPIHYGLKTRSPSITPKRGWN